MIKDWENIAVEIIERVAALNAAGKNLDEWFLWVDLDTAAFEISNTRDFNTLGDDAEYLGPLSDLDPDGALVASDAKSRFVVLFVADALEDADAFGWEGLEDDDEIDE